MGQEHHDEDRALADRLVNYADAAVALSVVGISGLGIAVADPETRSSVARAANWVMLSNIALGALFTAIVTLLRAWEADLRSDSPPSTKGRRYSRRLHVARLIVIWISVAQAVVLMLMIR